MEQTTITRHDSKRTAREHQNGTEQGGRAAAATQTSRPTPSDIPSWCSSAVTGDDAVGAELTSGALNPTANTNCSLPDTPPTNLTENCRRWAHGHGSGTEESPVARPEQRVQKSDMSHPVRLASRCNSGLHSRQPRPRLLETSLRGACMCSLHSAGCGSWPQRAPGRAAAAR